MKIAFHYDKKKLIATGVFFVIALLMFVQAGYPIPYLFLFPAGYFLILCADISFSKNWRWVTWLWTVVYFCFGPWFSTLCIQHIILEPELFDKTKDSILKLNMFAVACIYLFALVLIGEARWAWWTAHVFCLLAAFIDYYVYEFRENEVTFMDITSVGTGIGVMRSYRLTMHDRGAIAILISVLIMALIRKSRIEMKRFVRWIIRGAALIVLVVNVRYVMGRTEKMVTQTWEKKGSYKNGFVVNFVLGIQDGIIHEPEGYSEEEIAALETAYGKPETAPAGTEAGEGETGAEVGAGSGETGAEGGAESGETGTEGAAGDSKESSVNTGTDGAEDDDPAAALEGKKPVIITVMDESFADFRILGDLKTNQEVMPFLDSMEENTMKGFALSSVFGAKTPNSEWEYMTGNCMAFLPEGSVVYEQFLSKEPTSLVSTLRNEGYTAVAMHPYQKTGWRRNAIYPKNFGFEETYFLEDGYFDETKIMREYITDQELFDKIIDRYELQQEEHPDEPLFIMSITMQNHGGYRQTYENFTNEITFESSLGWFEDANQYLSLCHETDKAVKNLISYFENVDVPVEIIFFGDHLPSLQTSAFRALNGKGISGLTLTELERLFSVPFFIWTNYDTPEKKVNLTSFNFLSTLALERAGIDLPPYNAFLADLMKVVPAMNARAFYSPTEKKFLHYDKASGKEKEWIDRYNYLQYNEMFDKDGKSDWFFPYLKAE